VHWCEPTGYRPFWAVTRHADIKAISSQPERFANAPRTMLLAKQLEDQGLTRGIRTLVSMDPPEHRGYRAIASSWFRPGTLRSIDNSIRDTTRRLFDSLADRSGTFDFVTEFSSWLPLKVICSVLGAAEEDEALVLQIANTAFGLEDPEFGPKMTELAPRMVAYYQRIMTDRQANPTDDLYSAIANATIDGEPIGIIELVSYLLIMTTAGHDTTRNALTGGLLALIERPDQLARLQENPRLAAVAADEIIRWTSPVIQFCRTATEDSEVAGQPIKAGENLSLFFPSGSRDENVFEDADAFQVDRDPNPHLGFGFGEHYCLGASLARMEIRIFLEEFLPRVRNIQLTGTPLRTAASFVGGVKHLPIQWELNV
jgi:cytochrome P450